MDHGVLAVAAALAEHSHRPKGQTFQGMKAPVGRFGILYLQSNSRHYNNVQRLQRNFSALKSREPIRRTAPAQRSVSPAVDSILVFSLTAGTIPTALSSQKK